MVSIKLVVFELAAHNAVQEVFPQIRNKGCRFHFGQEFWRKLQSKSMTYEISQTSVMVPDRVSESK